MTIRRVRFASLLVSVWLASSGFGSCGESDPDDRPSDEASNGASCTDDEACASGYCVEGVCCEAACDGLCESCDQLGYMGSCRSIDAGEDPDEECAGTGLCGGTCDGAGGCMYPGEETACDTCTTCSGDGFCNQYASPGTDPHDDCDACSTCTGASSCAFVEAGTDPVDDCDDEGPCGQDGACDGVGACQLYADDVVAAPPACSATAGNLTPAAYCDGAGSQSPVDDVFCNGHVCEGDACNTLCVDAADCVAGYYCDEGACLPTSANGASCAVDAECTSGHCVDSICCDSACDGPCLDCGALGGTLGTCAAHAALTDPEVGCGATLCDGDGACLSSCANGSECKPGYWCDADGACVAKADVGAGCTAGEQCTSGFCVDDVCCGSACDGLCEGCAVAGMPAGTCAVMPWGTDPDDECAGSDATCGGTCNGSGACYYPAAATDCGACRRCDGAGSCGYVIADTDPDGDCAACQACDGAGGCAPQVAGADVKNDCSNEGPCGLDGTCDGASACRYYSSTTEFVPAFCAADDLLYGADLCDGAGGVTDGGSSDCAPYACPTGADACAVTCATDADCGADAFCDVNDLDGDYVVDECLFKRDVGNACAVGTECSSTYCFDAVCCNAACSDTCQACDLPDQVGTCAVDAGCALTLTVVKTGNGSGTVTSVPAGIDCGSTCDAAFADPVTVTLTAVADPTSTFVGFSGSGCSGAGPCVIDVTKDRVIRAEFSGDNNVVFVTSTAYLPLTVGSLAGADAICDSHATSAGLSGNFVAWLSDSSTDARDRLVGARGWVRPDGRPVVDSVDDLLAGRILYPPNRDEHGVVNTLPNGVMTGTLADGTFSGANCSDFTSSSANITIGAQAGSTTNWTNFATSSGIGARMLYCFQVDYANPVAFAPADGPTAFLSSSTFVGSTGLAGADATCQIDADAAGLTGTYRALLATSTSSAASRLFAAGRGWVRTDGVELTPPAADFLTGTWPLATLNVTADAATYVSDNNGNGYVVTGATSVTALGGNTCVDWTELASSFDRGVATASDAKFFNRGSARGCGSRYYLYCLQDNHVNYAFVTSTSYTGAQVGGLSGADALCNARAAAGGLPGTYVAWLSDSSTDAIDRLAGARGWVRPDGEPFADSAADLSAGRVLDPLDVDELGNHVADDVGVHTGTLADGTVATGLTCADWSSNTGSARHGLASGGAAVWTSATDGTCAAAQRLYCLGTDHAYPVRPWTTEGRIAFLSEASFEPGYGLAFADGVCQAEATAAGLDGSYLALLATADASAASRFNPAGPTWMRPDGVPIAASASDLLGGGALLAAIDVSADGTRYDGDVPVLTGALSVTASSATTCNDWLDAGASSTYQGRTGHSDAAWFNSAEAVSCAATNLRFYCLEE